MIWPDSLKLSSSVAILILVRTLTLAATDPFLFASPPSFTSNRVEFNLTGEASVGYVIESSTDLQNWSPLATNYSSEILRSITLEASNSATFYRTWRTQLPKFAGALVARSNIILNDAVLIDSFDSADPNHSSPAGRYDSSKAKDGGDVLCAEGFASLGNSNVRGTLRTGPTGGSSLGPYGSVGSSAWALFNTGIQPGRYDDNFRFALPDVAPPFESGIPPVGSGTNVWFLSSAAYFYPGNFVGNSNDTIYINGNAAVYVTGDMTMNGNITIATGASLKLYVGGASASLGSISTTGNVTNFQYYGLPANTSLAWSGNKFAGIVYAPQASLTLSGGGSAPFDFEGSCVVESVTTSGYFRFHYDENLKVSGPQR